MREPYCATSGASSSVRRAAATTLSPAARATSAMSRPRPLPAPVINQVLCGGLGIEISFCFDVSFGYPALDAEMTDWLLILDVRGLAQKTKDLASADGAPEDLE